MKLSYVLAALAAPILAAAAPGGTPTVTVTVTAVTVTAISTATAVSECAVDAVQCCDAVSSSSNLITSLLIGLLDVVIEGLDVPIGINCSPTTIAGVGGSSCTAAPLCCENNTFNGLIAIGCVPIIINL